MVRTPPGHRDVADKMWAAIGRVTGTIVERHEDSLLVNEGVTNRPQVVLIPPPRSPGSWSGSPGWSQGTWSM